MPTVYVTAPREAAQDLARALVEERLVACVNLVGCRSIYRWDGEVHDDDESVLLAKTTGEGYDRLLERIETLHPYDVPCIERFDESDAFEPYADWIEGAVEGSAADESGE